MNKSDLWAAYLEANPIFDEGPINFTAEGLHKFFEQTWKAAYEQGKGDGAAFERKIEKANNPLNDLFNTFK